MTDDNKFELDAEALEEAQGIGELLAQTLDESTLAEALSYSLKQAVIEDALDKNPGALSRLEPEARAIWDRAAEIAIFAWVNLKIAQSRATHEGTEKGQDQ